MQVAQGVITCSQMFNNAAGQLWWQPRLYTVQMALKTSVHCNGILPSRINMNRTNMIHVKKLRRKMPTQLKIFVNPILKLVQNWARGTSVQRTC